MRSPHRRLLMTLATAWVAAVAGLGALGALGVLGWVSAAQLAALAAIGVAVAAVGLQVSRVGRRLQRFSEELDTRLRAVSETVDAGRRETTRSIDTTTEEVHQVRSQALPRLSREVRRAIVQQGRSDYEQQVAWAELRDHLDPEPFMPPLRGWAASPDVLRILVRLIDERHPKLVVECGSGSSSVWLGQALRRAGGGHLVALEHEQRYAELSRELVAAHRLDDVVEVRHAPLVDWPPSHEETGQGTSQPWYDLRAVADLNDIGLVFVDGPPEATAPQARFPAVPVLLPHCAPDAIVVLDDAARASERTVGERWLADHPELSRRDESTEKGALVLTRHPV